MTASLTGLPGGLGDLLYILVLAHRQPSGSAVIHAPSTTVISITVTCQLEYKGGRVVVGNDCGALSAASITAWQLK